MAQLNSLIEHLRKDDRTPFAIAGILGIGIIVVIWQFIASFHDIATKPLKIKAPVFTPPPAIASLHLLGTYDTTIARDIPVTQLQLTLAGTVVVIDAPKLSRALIISPGEPTKVYGVGDTVPGDAIVKEITKHYVILSDDGRLQKLSLPIKKLANSP